MTPKRLKILEVIVTSLQDAIEAEQGGADRLEAVRDLEHGGLTPDLDLVRQIVAAVKIPVRVMLRENTSMSLLNAQELNVLLSDAALLSALAVDGLVIGFILDGEVDVATLRAIVEAAPKLRVTFHRAFDELPDPQETIRILKTIPQIDRILTIGGAGSWPTRKSRLHYWQKLAAPEITIMAGAGLLEPVITDLQRDQEIGDVHIGRAARVPQETDGKVCRVQVAQLKGLSA